MTIRAIDLSFSRLAEALPSDLDGVDLVIQDLWTGALQPPNAMENLSTAQLWGKRIAGYIVTNPDVGDNAGEALIRMTPDLRRAIEFASLDCELYSQLTSAKVRQESNGIADSIGRPRVLYTVRSYWQHTLGDDPTFGDHLVWDARPGDPVPPFVRYGAWGSEDQVLGVQTSSTVVIGGGVAVDFSTFDLEKLTMLDDDSEQIKNIASHEARMKIAAAVLTNDMVELVRLLGVFGVTPPAVTALKPTI